MGNYHDLEADFVERTLRLIDQYYASLDNYPFEEQFNYTLTINCLLGLVVMPKERVITYIPTSPLTKELLAEIGLQQSMINEHITSLRELIQKIRHSIAHFDIKVISESEEQLIDWVEFNDSKQDSHLVARFKAQELLPFLKYYAICLLENMKKFRVANT